MRLKPIGLITIGLFLLAPLWWFVPLAGRYDPVAILSQYLGASALVAMSFSQLLATRWRPVELLFGSLDRVYVLHKWLGVGALAALIMHDTIDADVPGFGRETALTEVAETLGEIGLYVLIGLVVITLITFVPYQLWRWTHRFMGAVFVLGTLHFLFILRPFALTDPLGIYIATFCTLGMVAYAYALSADLWLRRGHRYSVSALNRTGGALVVNVEPRGRGIHHRAGQFAFFKFDQPGLDETHPFTISSAPDSTRALRITIKSLGDFTRRLVSDLQVGTDLSVEGPYGHFGPTANGSTEIWIAGGIGITPFLARAQTLQSNGPLTHLFLSVRDRAMAPHLDDLEALAAELPNFHLHLTETAKASRLTAAAIAASVDTELSQTQVSFCGPEAMREGLGKQFTALGLPPKRFRYEAFEIRSGIGLRRMWHWLTNKYLARKRTPASPADPAMQ